MVRFLVVLSICLTTAGLRAAEPKLAYEVLPDSAQAVVWIANSDAIADGWAKTQLAQLAEDPSIKEFWEDQRAQIEEKLTSAGWRLQIAPRDLADIVQGQVALAWLEQPNDVRKPFALALLVDVATRVADTQKFLGKLDGQLKERGSQRSQLTHAGVEITQHTLKRQNGELMPQETFYAIAGEQLLATDDLAVLKDLIDATQATSLPAGRLKADATFQAARAELKSTQDMHVEYFVRPLGFARVIRAIGGKRHTGKADVLAVLQNQGFGAIKAVCGELALGQREYDVFHRGYVLADGERPRSVQILDFPNEVQRNVPGWVSDRVSSMLATCWNVKEAFWKVDGIVDEMAGQSGVFNEIIQGIKDDATGPRIDIAKDVIPLLTNEIYSVSDSKEPIDIDSRRNLIALRVKDSEKMAKILNQAMETEPDAKKVTLNGQQIWQVAHEEDELSLEIENDFGSFNKPAGGKPGAAAEPEEATDEPWLSNWAITVHGDYLMFASHVEMISEAIEQSQAGSKSPLVDQADYQRIAGTLEQLFGKDASCIWRINRSALAYRPQYELFRAGKLQQSQSMLADLLEHLVQNKSEIQQAKPALDGTKLPPFETISKYLHPSGTNVRTTDKGWEFGAVLLAPANATASSSTTLREPNAANKPVQPAATNR